MMGWRDRVKNSFGDFDHIEEGVKNLKKQEKERKEPFKTTFRPYTHNPQNPQNRQNEGEKPKTEKKDSMAKNSIKQNPGLQQQHDALWQKAWTLADWIDNPGPEIPWQERAARVPELQAMSLELDQLEKLMRDELLPLIPIDNRSVEEAPINLRLQSDFLQGFSPLVQVTQGKQYTVENCPARCQNSDKCYGKAFFDGKPGKSEFCIPGQCRWGEPSGNKD